MLPDLPDLGTDDWALCLGPDSVVAGKFCDGRTSQQPTGFQEWQIVWNRNSDCDCHSLPSSSTTSSPSSSSSSSPACPSRVPSCRRFLPRFLAPPNPCSSSYRCIIDHSRIVKFVFVFVLVSSATWYGSTPPASPTSTPTPNRTTRPDWG